MAHLRPKSYHNAMPSFTIEPSFGDWLQRRGANFDAVVFDIDGVLMVAHQPAPGAGELVARLRGEGKPFFLLTNDGCHSPEEKCAALAACGMEFSPEEIVSSGHGLAEWVEAAGRGGELFFAMGSLGRPCYGERAGLRITRSLERLPECRGVVVGEKDYDWEPVINAVFNHLIRSPSPTLVTPNPDEYFRRGDALHLASGAVARFLQQVCRTYGRPVEPAYLGKPYAPIFETNHHRIERALGRRVARERVLIVGDSLEADIRGGRDFGYRTALVLTGVTPADALARAEVAPDFVFERL